MSSTQKDAAFIPTDDAIREMYEASKTDKIKKVNHQTFRTMTVSSVVIVKALILFGFHWKLFKKYD